VAGEYEGRACNITKDIAEYISMHILERAEQLKKLKREDGK